jgi:hypothetical protein
VLPESTTVHWHGLLHPRNPARDASLDYQQDVVIRLQEWLEREGYTYPAMLMAAAIWLRRSAISWAGVGRWPA